MLRLIPDTESLSVQFNSDPGPLPDAELAAAVVCLAVTRGGDRYIRVENDGRVTGLHPSHRSIFGVVALVAIAPARLSPCAPNQLRRKAG
ncbi:MAG: hypothetical protein FJX77_12065 [Armatimonadetes bacterium]|nr:hypothetical protein [Armatimonadota bacterium]